MKHAYFSTILWLGTAAASAQGLTNSGTTITLDAGTTLQVQGALLNTATGTLTAPITSVVQITGNVINQGTLTLPGQLVLNGSTDQTLQGGSGTFGTIEVNNTGALGANRVLVPTDLTITTQLLLMRGLVRTTPTATVRLLDMARVIGEGAGRYVQGNLSVQRATVDAGTGVMDFSHGLVLDPQGQNLGAVTITRTAGLQLAGQSYGTNFNGNQGIDRVWQVVAAQPPSTPITLTLSWVADDDHAVNAAASLQAWRAETAAGPWVPFGVAASATARRLTVSGTQLGTLTLSSTSQPLPVELVRFAVERQGPDGLVRWATASEHDNAYFEVESSVDGQAFHALGRVAGQGTSTTAHTYQWVDQNLARYAAEQIYYRLHQVDLDGTGAYSPVQALRVPLVGGLQVQAWPNPYQQQLTLTVHTQEAGTALVQLTDAVGRQLRQRQISLPVGTTTFPAEDAIGLLPGVYLLHVQQGTQQRTLKLVRE
ncbi:T9SS type A sorting domain-containing protein [Hymenobacter sp. GOD-10R]|uniref:T9SS type A sorting domain-containing protein n=1 Tax=Hymenobacter sp. GOD-10R TaxID=3093922 RepID=UPI002D77E6CC|nr:T9SS type A sorting domain-containing protein [Hymenobacter sp. GOD-10R]WRQ27044.1 T9SS type A sorting domain-containing protein [Hymenobacter sp. GOD-10R]